MKIMSREDFLLFKNLVGLTQEGMRKSMSAYLKKKYKKVISTKDYIIAVGDIPVALVAHMDTVFPTPATQVFYDKEQGVIWSPQGLGADDRAGIFAILKILQARFRPTVIFTTDEEIGCIGASNLALTMPKPPTDLKYIIQLDRRGTNDCVFYDCDNQEFIKYIEAFGFIENIGSFSDISMICPEWKIAGVNLSIGYVGEHSISELLYVAPMYSTIEKVKKILSQPEHQFFEYVEAYSCWSLKSTKNLWGYPTEEDFQCDECGRILTEFEVIPAKNAAGEELMFCPDCCSRKVDWCDICKEGFVVHKDAGYKEMHICPECLIRGNKGSRTDV